MKVVYTDQSIDSLHKTMEFLLDEQGLPIERVSEIKTQLLDRADSLAIHPHLGQTEEYLEHLNQNHRRLVEGHLQNSRSTHLHHGFF